MGNIEVRLNSAVTLRALAGRNFQTESPHRNGQASINGQVTVAFQMGPSDQVTEHLGTEPGHG